MQTLILGEQSALQDYNVSLKASGKKRVSITGPCEEMTKFNITRVLTSTVAVGTPPPSPPALSYDYKEFEDPTAKHTSDVAAYNLERLQQLNASTGLTATLLS